MFTGLIKTQGEIRRVDQRGDRLITIAMREPFPVEIGDSVACHGICLTVTKTTGHEFKVSLSAETLARTNANDWAVGTQINLEPSLRVGESMGGHFVSGHIDGLAQVIRSEKSGDSTIWEFEAPAALGKFIAPKGSITLDGISLTVNSVQDTVNQRIVSNSEPLGEKNNGEVQIARLSPGATKFTVNIIPHTTEVTSFKTLQLGTRVNVEIDMLARYVARLQESKR